MQTTDSKSAEQAELSPVATESILKVQHFFRGLQLARSATPPVPDAETVAQLKSALLIILKEADFTQAISSSGIPTQSSFADETIRMIKGKILPYLHDPKDACTIIHSIFSSESDHDKIAALFALYPKPGELFTSEEKQEMLKALMTQITNSVHIISYRIAALGMDEDVYLRAGKDDALVTPFMEQNHEVNELLANIEKGNTEKIAEDLAQTRIMIQHCIANIALIDKAAEKNGTSLRQTYLLRKLELLIARLTKLLPVVSYDEADIAFEDLLSLLQHILLAETRPQKLRHFISRNLNMIAYRITENKRKTGEHYITSDSTEYWDLFISACGGGFIVSFMVLIKLMIHNLHLPMLWEGLLYSISYAGGFVVIQLLHFTLATKQPAMTAAFLAASLDDIKDDSSRYHHLAATVAKVSRSQLVSFAGNLIIVFPCTALWIFALDKLTTKSIVSPEAANDLLMAVHPLHSLSFLYASIAGVFLFLAGIISGFGDNKVVVSSIGLRLEAHPFLKRILSANSRHRLASYMEKNLGPLLGNTILGFMLGMAGFIGKISGLPFDIRHITFSTGNIALGFYGTREAYSVWFILAILLGIFIIGFFNFVISFGLALQGAARSRGLKLSDYPDVAASIWSYFKLHPAHFFYPERKRDVAVAQ